MKTDPKSKLVYIVGSLGCYPEVKTETYVLHSAAFSTTELAEVVVRRYREKHPEKTYCLLAWSRELWTGDVDRLVENGKVIEW